MKILNPAVQAAAVSVNTQRDGSTTVHTATKMTPHTNTCQPPSMTISVSDPASPIAVRLDARPVPAR